MARVAILVEEQYQVLEVWYPYFRLIEEGMEVDLIGTGKAIYPSKEGYPCEVNKQISEVKASDYQGVVIPGGWAPDFLRRFPEINKFVRDIFDAGACVASICHGGWVLTSADVVKGKKATSFIAIKDDMVHAGAEYLDEEVVVDGNLITSRTPFDLPAFTKAVIDFISK